MAPPADVYEDPDRAPGADYTYLPGYWNWRGSEYVWYHGYWGPHRDGFAYVHPYWTVVNGRWGNSGWGWEHYDTGWETRHAGWEFHGGVWERPGDFQVRVAVASRHAADFRVTPGTWQGHVFGRADVDVHGHVVGAVGANVHPGDKITEPKAAMSHPRMGGAVDPGKGSHAVVGHPGEGPRARRTGPARRGAASRTRTRSPMHPVEAAHKAGEPAGREPHQRGRQARRGLSTRPQSPRGLRAAHQRGRQARRGAQGRRAHGARAAHQGSRQARRGEAGRAQARSQGRDPHARRAPGRGEEARARARAQGRAAQAARPSPSRRRSDRHRWASVRPVATPVRIVPRSMGGRETRSVRVAGRAVASR